MSAADVHSILYRGENPLEDFSVLQKKKTSFKPTRQYWPGKAPEYAADGDDNNFEDTVNDDVPKDTQLQEKRLHRIIEAQTLNENSVGIRKREREVVIRANDKQEELKSKLEDVVVKITDYRSCEESRTINLLKRREEERLLNIVAENSEAEEDEEESSEYESDSDAEAAAISARLKPIFVPKDKRDVVRERELRKLEEEKIEDEKQRQLMAKKAESQKLVLELIKQDELEVKDITVGDTIDNMPDDRDDIASAEEYEQWKLRELKRIKRDKMMAEQRNLINAEVERRRQMTEEERRLDDKRLDSMAIKREVKYKLNFMQKYYHRGAFFQDRAQTGEEPLYLRDYNAPVGEDKMDKKILPRVMRLRRGQFGRQGQVKHTHLVDVDTTDFSVPWAHIDNIRLKFLSNVAGCKSDNQFCRPTTRKDI